MKKNKTVDIEELNKIFSPQNFDILSTEEQKSKYSKFFLELKELFENMYTLHSEVTGNLENLNEKMEKYIEVTKPKFSIKRILGITKDNKLKDQEVFQEYINELKKIVEILPEKLKNNQEKLSTFSETLITYQKEIKDNNDLSHSEKTGKLLNYKLMVGAFTIPVYLQKTLECINETSLGTIKSMDGELMVMKASNIIYNSLNSQNVSTKNELTAESLENSFQNISKAIDSIEDYRLKHLPHQEKNNPLKDNKVIKEMRNKFTSNNEDSSKLKY